MRRGSVRLTFTREQETTLIIALCSAALEYAQPEIVLDTLRVISPRAAASVAQHLDERARKLLEARPDKGEAA